MPRREPGSRDNLFELSAGGFVFAKSFEYQPVSKLCFRAGVIFRYCLVFVERSLVITAGFDSSGIKKMSVGRFEVGVFLDQQIERLPGIFV